MNSKSIVQAAILFGMTNSIATAQGDEFVDIPRSIWKPDTPKYRNVDDRECETSWDCPLDDYICAGHNWEYNGQFESAVGCWHKSVCKDEAFYMFDGRKLQYFCDEEAAQKTQMNWGELEYPIVPAGNLFWTQFQSACDAHEDCWDKSGDRNQLCTPFIWEGDDQEISFGSGSACYAWDEPTCEKGSKSPSFAIVNENYENTQFSYYTQMWCADYRSMTKDECSDSDDSDCDSDSDTDSDCDSDDSDCDSDDSNEDPSEWMGDNYMDGGDIQMKGDSEIHIFTAGAKETAVAGAVVAMTVASTLL